MIEQKNSAAAEIRAAFEELGWDAAPKAVIEELQRKEIAVTPQQVSNQKTRRAKLMAEVKVEDLPVSVLKKVKRLVDEVGSTEVVRRALDELDHLTKGRS
jgi:hypothetical protein